MQTKFPASIARLLIVIFVSLFLFNRLAVADVSLASPFGDNMVLQRDVEVPIWGWSDPGDEVRVIVRGKLKETVADVDGCWMVKLDPLKVGDPFPIRVVGSHNEINLTNVVAGEVWVCSGQSNMAWTVNRSANAREEIAKGDYPDIRHFQVNRATHVERQLVCENSGWQACSPATVGEFTAVGYYFARKLHRELKVPIGLVNTTWGGTIVETWTSGGSLESQPDFVDRVAKIRASAGSLEKAKQDFEAEMQKWQERHDAAMDEAMQKSESFAGPLDDSNWKLHNVPGRWEQQGLPRFDGLAWYRRSVEIPQQWVGKELALSLGTIDDNDRTFVNGRQVGETIGWDQARNYKIPAELTAEKNLTIAIQVNDTGGAGGFYGKPDKLSVSGPDGDPIALSGKWRFQKTDAFKQLPARPRMGGLQGPNHPTLLFNAMVNPLIPLKFKGVVWYQGEGNADRAHQYQTLFPLLINDWREQWKTEFPFYWVQLANFKAVANQPGPSEWAELREAQTMALKLPKTGEAVIIDIGNARNIHPKNKQDVGKRLALIALKQDYGRELIHSGPRYREMKIEGNKIRLMFDFAEGIKASDGKDLARFEIAAADKKFVWADAVIKDGSVVVSSANVDEPVAARYAWANNPEGCNLTNESGLPASPFRTDDWPGVTFGNK